mmetsp:Transcript_4670/g.10329  ORF Transcript_4670/g.10329 Transcript_4670/m.10329 type:complete len:321 (+) Transcript_4670:34-996(+)|eukprot:CAMPEP_0204275470 /NCGR_PEP_ID=MMETSP0468-20130131/26058_1 /ASSEMBLY_ACC=CAM_ASM_000383 /TAXON_ID=2969 /ORGANISM="Oxyrrhis marina" /LENGTH=320 /DNA_ID=CAMNT_0051251813 /DNA_START=33 /DNA_END=995 /DNA_ORIENTATION=-
MAYAKLSRSLGETADDDTDVLTTSRLGKTVLERLSSWAGGAASPDAGTLADELELLRELLATAKAEVLASKQAAPVEETSKRSKGKSASSSSSPPKAKAPKSEGACAGDGEVVADGVRVRIQGLVAKPEHNGNTGKVQSYDGSKGRYAIRLENGVGLSIKRSNFEVVKRKEAPQRDVQILSGEDTSFVPVTRTASAPSPAAQSPLPTQSVAFKRMLRWGQSNVVPQSRQAASLAYSSGSPGTRVDIDLGEAAEFLEHTWQSSQGLSKVGEAPEHLQRMYLSAMLRDMGLAARRRYGTDLDAEPAKFPSLASAAAAATEGA